MDNLQFLVDIEIYCNLFISETGCSLSAELNYFCSELDHVNSFSQCMSYCNP